MLGVVEAAIGDRWEQDGSKRTAIKGHDGRRGATELLAELYRVKGCWSTYNALEPFTYDAGAERASSAAHHPFCDSCPMLRTKSSGGPDNGARGCTEPVNECPIIGRSVIRAFGDSGGNCNWTYSNRTNFRPELVRVLHLLFPLHVNLMRWPVRVVSHSIAGLHAAGARLRRGCPHLMPILIHPRTTRHRPGTQICGGPGPTRGPRPRLTAWPVDSTCWHWPWQPDAQAGWTTLLTIHACLPTGRTRVKPFCSKSSTVALNRKRPCAWRPAVTSEIASTSPPPR